MELKWTYKFTDFMYLVCFILRNIHLDSARSTPHCSFCFFWLLETCTLDIREWFTDFVNSCPCGACALCISVVHNFINSTLNAVWMYILYVCCFRSSKHVKCSDGSHAHRPYKYTCAQTSEFPARLFVSSSVCSARATLWTLNVCKRSRKYFNQEQYSVLSVLNAQRHYTSHV